MNEAQGALGTAGTAGRHFSIIASPTVGFGFFCFVLFLGYERGLDLKVSLSVL